MLTSNDIGELFASMRTAYGQQWKHGPQAMQVWRNALARHSPEDIRRAATKSLEEYVDYPPTLPQFMQILRPNFALPSRANTYIAPPKMRPVEQAANRTLLHVLMHNTGIDSATMKHMVQLKNALLDDFGEDKATEDFTRGLHKELTALAQNSRDSERFERELETAKDRFRRRVGASA